MDFQSRKSSGKLRLRAFQLKEKFNINSNGADTAYICKYSAYLHTKKCAQNVASQITLKSTVNKLNLNQENIHIY